MADREGSADEILPCVREFRGVWVKEKSDVEEPSMIWMEIQRGGVFIWRI